MLEISSPENLTLEQKKISIIQAILGIHSESILNDFLNLLISREEIKLQPKDASKNEFGSITGKELSKLIQKWEKSPTVSEDDFFEWFKKVK